MDNDLEGAKNMKLVLCVFEHFSDIKINSHKTELFCHGATKDFEEEHSQIFGCSTGNFPSIYLVILMHHKKLSNADWREVKEHFQKKVKCLERQDALYRRTASAY
jgi:hypothetical protein